MRPAVSERTTDLKALCKGSNLRVQGYSSPDSGTPLSSPTENIAICSYEKGNSAINRVLSGAKAHELCCVVVDEFHMLVSADRGAALEVRRARAVQSFKVFLPARC